MAAFENFISLNILETKLAWSIVLIISHVTFFCNVLFVVANCCDDVKYDLHFVTLVRS